RPGASRAATPGAGSATTPCRTPSPGPACAVAAIPWITRPAAEPSLEPDLPYGTAQPPRRDRRVAGHPDRLPVPVPAGAPAGAAAGGGGRPRAERQRPDPER